MLDHVDLIMKNLDQIDDWTWKRWNKLADCYECHQDQEVLQEKRPEGQEWMEMMWAFDKRKVECFNCHNTGHFAGMHINWVRAATIIQCLQAKYDELQSEFGNQEAALVAHKLAVKKLESQLKASHKQQSSLNEKLNFQANQIFEKDEKLKKYRRIGMKAVKDKDVLQKIVDSWFASSKNLWKLVDCGMSSTVKIGLGYGIKSNAEVLGYEEEISRGIFAFRETNAGYNDIPLYSRFKQVEYKGVPHPLSGDYTPREQEDIDDSLYEYGKYGPQPQSPSPIESDASSTVSSTCQSNDSDGEQGTVSDHSVNDDPIPMPSSEQVSTSIQRTQPQVPKPQQTVDPSCAQHVKTPRQPIRTQVTPSPIPSHNRQNWNQRMERELGIVDNYEKKMAREAAFQSTRVVHANVRQATPAWTNTNRVNKANQFTPRPVPLSNIRPNLSTASNTIKTGRVNVNTGHGNVSSGRVHVNSVSQFKSGASRFNTGPANMLIWAKGHAVKTLARLVNGPIFGRLSRTVQCVICYLGGKLKDPDENQVFLKFHKATQLYYFCYDKVDSIKGYMFISKRSFNEAKIEAQELTCQFKEVIDIDVQTEEDADLMVVSSTSLSEKDCYTEDSLPKAAIFYTNIQVLLDDIFNGIVEKNWIDARALTHLDQYLPVNTGNAEAISPSADHEEEVFSDADDDEMPEIRIYDKSSEGIFEKASYDDDGIITDFNNLPDEVDVSTNHTLRIHNAHPQSQILGDPNTPVQTRSSLKKITEAHALVSYMQAQQRSNHKDQQHCLFACFLSQSEPKKVSEALEDASWVEAMQEELLQFKLQQVWVLVDLPNGAKGLHQAPRAWYATLSNFLEKHGYRRGTIDKTLFIKKDKKDIILVQIYVDDIIFGNLQRSLGCDEFEALMNGRKEISNDAMGELTFFAFVLVRDFQCYAAANLERKSTTGGCQLSWKAGTTWSLKGCCRLNLDMKKDMPAVTCQLDANWLDSGFPQMFKIEMGINSIMHTYDSIDYTITEESVRRQLQLADDSGITMLQNEEIFEGLQNIGQIKVKLKPGACSTPLESTNSTPPFVPTPTPSTQTPPLTQPVQSTLSPPISTIPDTQPTHPPSPQISSPPYNETEGPSFDPSSHMSPPPSHELEIQTSRTSEESEAIEKPVDLLENKLRQQRKREENEYEEDAAGQDQDIPSPTHQGDTFVTPEKSKDLGEAQAEQISPSTLEVAQILTNVASEGFQGSQALLELGVTDVNAGSTPSVQVNTGSTPLAQVSTAEVNTAELNTGETERVQRRKGKAPMTEEDLQAEVQASKKTREQELQELAGLEAAQKLQATMDAETQRQIDLDALLARRLVEQEEEAAKEALATEFDYIQARLNADQILAEKIQQEEREQYSIEERAKFLHDTIAAQGKGATKRKVRHKKKLKAKEESMSLVYREDDDLKDVFTSSSWVKILSWTSPGLVIICLLENRYPLIKEVLSQLLDLKLETEEESTMALELIKFCLLQQLEELGDSDDDVLAESDHDEKKVLVLANHTHKWSLGSTCFPELRTSSSKSANGSLLGKTFSNPFYG
ncbi:putative ribonuclease H-like domain-containing protein [Tanacetum coccineum]|uniref:Ribonuclease H-like domain-containing protein n=1 Tax=Tanacetum coccineum TaxID=301880 RepID=A0ABQ4ZE59_9ASTR